MNKLDKIELENKIKSLQVRNNEIKGLILAENNLENAEQLDKEFKANMIEITEAENKLANAPKGEKNMSNYLESENAVVDFFESLTKASNKAEANNKWRAKLIENGIEVKDDELLTPKRLIFPIETTLTNANPIFKIFQLTHAGQFLTTQSLTSDGEAMVHKEGEDKKIQSTLVTLDSIAPQYVYDLTTFSERLKNIQANFGEIYASQIAVSTQKIVNKVVDLALQEGDATNGFVALVNEKDEDKVAKISSTTLVEGIEDATDFVRGTTGKKYLIITSADRKALLKEVRKLEPNVRIKNNDLEIANEVGVDELIIYTGTKAIKPTVIVDQAYHVDMKDLTKVDAFEWKTNENALLLESLSSGKMNKLKAAAIITVTP